MQIREFHSLPPRRAQDSRTVTDVPCHDISAHGDLDQSELRLGLPRIGIITSHEHVVVLGTIDNIGNESVLWRVGDDVRW